MSNTFFIKLIIILFFLYPKITIAQDAGKIVKSAAGKMLGEQASYIEKTMKIERPTWERTIMFQTWTKDTTYSMTLITAPEEENGISFLKIDQEMWEWESHISRFIDLKSSMMPLDWMGSDYIYNDILKPSSILVNYNYKIIGEEEISGYKCYKIEMDPTETATIWGKIIQWISINDSLQLKTEYFDEDNDLVRTKIASEIKKMDGRLIPTHFETLPDGYENQKTVVDISKVSFNPEISSSFFTVENMKHPNNPITSSIDINSKKSGLQVKILGNPSHVSDAINFTIQSPTTNQININIFTINGRSIYAVHRDFMQKDIQHYEIPADVLNKGGTYFLRVSDCQKMRLCKIVRLF